MKKRITSMFLVLLMVLSLMPATVQASPASSVSGTKADPYLIATAQDLVDFRDEVNASTKKSTSMLCAKLTKDIDLSNLEGDWEPIGKATNTYKDYVAYGGTFDGDGHTISGLSINATTAYQGLFGCDHINHIFRICGRYRGLWISGHHRELCESGNGYGNKERIYCRYCRIYKYDREQY